MDNGFDVTHPVNDVHVHLASKATRSICDVCIHGLTWQRNVVDRLYQLIRDLFPGNESKTQAYHKLWAEHNAHIYRNRRSRSDFHNSNDSGPNKG